jgi:hypothetical protein
MIYSLSGSCSLMVFGIRINLRFLLYIGTLNLIVKSLSLRYQRWLGSRGDTTRHDGVVVTCIWKVTTTWIQVFTESRRFVLRNMQIRLWAVISFTGSRCRSATGNWDPIAVFWRTTTKRATISFRQCSASFFDIKLFFTSAYIHTLTLQA